MSPKRKDRVAPPPGPDEWDLRYATNDAAKGWEELCRQVPHNLLRAWEALRTNPRPQPSTTRQHQLKGKLGTGTFDGRDMPCWQYEVTGGATRCGPHRDTDDSPLAQKIPNVVITVDGPTVHVRRIRLRARRQRRCQLQGFIVEMPEAPGGVAQTQARQPKQRTTRYRPRANPHAGLRDKLPIVIVQRAADQDAGCLALL
ncbi:hypothetical protein [Actinophytocola sediminis]